MKGKLVICGTPIGNLADVSFRLLSTLSSSDLIAAEDTRHSRKLLTHHGIAGKLIAYHDQNERTQTKHLLDRLLKGENVALVTDGGMPSISDPGYKLVAAAIDAGVVIEVVPGPSAVVAALAVSGLPTARFCFEGFLPRKAGDLRKRLTALADDDRTIIFFESPKRLKATLQMIAEVMGERRVAVAREMTKIHEEVIRGSASEVASGLDEVLGEVTVVVEGASHELGNLEVALADARRLIEEGVPPSKAAARAASANGVPRRDVYRSLVG